MREKGDFRQSWRIFRIMAEFVEGYQFLSELKNEVTILGSARFHPDESYYKVAYEIGKILAENNFTTITGGGPGIMEAANKGAFEGKGQSVGLNIELPFEQVLNPYVTRSTSFNYFFTRKVMLTSPAHAFVYFPGGFGTMDEFFEVVDLMELGMMNKSPIILVGSSYWKPLIKFLKSCCIEGAGSMTAEQINSWHVVDSAQEAFKYIKGHDDAHNQTCDLSADNFHCLENVNWRVFRIMSELVQGFEFVSGLDKDVTILGTKSIPKKSPYYQSALKVGKLAVKHGYTVITGGKYGIAEAVNRGAFHEGGRSIGIGMEVAGHKEVNSYLTDSIIFKFPFTRKLIVTAPSDAFIFFPGGFGTLHQLFEVLTLMQTSKIKKRPVILVDHKFWLPLHKFIKKVLVHDVDTVSDEDDELYQIVDNEEQIFEVISEWKSN
ncbi:MAG: hypothetical protein COV59_03270 [Candidatus Magasanikbacteria bacterium CG11_big_fil_rev_8_21_14_0_20_39_34]|uniref:Cytokinin riboside 5'-monophosphate phosphoribohydrolase n=1 Tax=Candidatus Magasanikbacteria bacterium CG11_big_fil_rev_8_21_14_0_20_39_34 TaxID=1974653 RepID=A0A2H0N5K1_9BACT|nr:MAG: hypothetical protein COV59_03270 [Candidatus Magasanikbacteria bacterium CG11_big_fil_rev_8_21_14_0_20_39_34]